MLVILESTRIPSTDELVRPILETGGLVAGQDFFLAFSPAGDPGNPLQHAECAEGGRRDQPDLRFARRGALSSGDRDCDPGKLTRVAEMVKLLENTFRAVNIRLVNEIALMCDALAIDVWEVVDAAATKPFGFMPFYPGPGLGGHCIPIEPSISRGRRSRAASKRGSSSSPARSTARCRRPWYRKSRTH